MNPTKRIVNAVFTIALVSIPVIAARHSSAAGPTIQEFPVPTASSAPSGIAAGPDGNLWFTEQEGNKIGRISPAGVITEFPLPTPRSLPTSIASGPDGNLWFTELYKIGRITPAGVITEFPLPTSLTSSLGIAAGPDGNLWFTEFDTNLIGRITPAGVLTEFAVPTPNSFPSGIAAGPDGNLWFTEQGGNTIGRISTAGVIAEFPLTPYSGNSSFPFGITSGPDGNLWFTQDFDRIGRISPTGGVTEFEIPAATTGRPTGITSGPDGNLWFTVRTNGGNSVGRITTAGVITEFTVPTANSGPNGITTGPDGSLWFTESIGNKIARLTPAATCTPSATTLCIADRFQVRVAWSTSQGGGQSGQGNAVSTSSIGFSRAGLFSFFSSTNPEMLVKVLDGCGSNGRYWVFSAAATNVGLTLTVTDVQAGLTKTYSNPDLTPVQPVVDTNAFATCP